MSEQNALPKGWAICNLGEIITVLRGVSYAKHQSKTIDFPNSVPILRATNINRLLDFDDLVYVETSCISPEQMLRLGDIVIAASSGSKSVVGKAAQLISDWHGSFGAFCMGLRPVAAIESSYVSYFLQTDEYRHRVSELSSGSNINNLKRDHIQTFPIRLAPPNEQRRIVEKIEELFSDLDAGVAALERAKANLKRYRAAVLKAAVDGSLTAEWRAKHSNVEPASKLLEHILVERRRKWEADQLAKFKASGKEPPKNWRAKYVEPKPPDSTDLPELPVGWCWATLDALSTIIGGYAFQSSHFSSEGIQVVKIANVRAGQLELSRQPEFIRVVDDDVIHKYSLMRGDILISLTGTRFKRDYGYTAVVNSDDRLLLNQRVARIRPFEMDCSHFLQIATTTPQFKDYFFSQETGNVGQGNVGMDSLRNAPLPLCPVSEQHEIAAEVEATMTTINALEHDVLASTKHAFRLRQSILKQAFEGKLVPQDPTDEPAQKLLDRIKSESQRHEANGKPTKMKPRKAKQKSS
jgi:type I restriction enzyme, S subunit